MVPREIEIGPIRFWFGGDADCGGDVQITAGESCFGGIEYVTAQEWREFVAAAGKATVEGHFHLDPKPEPASHGADDGTAVAGFRSFWDEFYSAF